MDLVNEPARWDIYLVPLDPTRGAEMKKTRPCVVVSPDELNRRLRTVIVAPLTGRQRSYPFRVDIDFEGRDGQIALDQLRTIDKGRLVRELGKLPGEVAQIVSQRLTEMFRL